MSGASAQRRPEPHLIAKDVRRWLVAAYRCPPSKTSPAVVATLGWLALIDSESRRAAVHDWARHRAERENIAEFLRLKGVRRSTFEDQVAAGIAEIVAALDRS